MCGPAELPASELPDDEPTLEALLAIELLAELTAELDGPGPRRRPAHELRIDLTELDERIDQLVGHSLTVLARQLGEPAEVTGKSTGASPAAVTGIQGQRAA